MNVRIPVTLYAALTLFVFSNSVIHADPIQEPVPAAHFTLTILHDNDLHGHLLPFPYTEVGRLGIEEPNVGGAARRATLIRRLRQTITHPTLLIDSGDTFTRGPLATTYEGLADVEAMNAIGYDVVAIGNNEFKAKDASEINDAAGAQAALLRLIARSRFPWICANATDAQGAFLQGVGPYVVRNINGVRVGFLGLTAPRSASYPQTKGWTISDPVAAANLWIPRARANCDILIAVTHIGVPLDILLAARTKGLDAIVGGDSHTFLYKPLVIPNAEGVGTPIVQDGEFGVNLGRFDLNFSRSSVGKWSLTNYHDELLPVRASLAEAPDVVSVLAPYVHPLKTIIGHLSRIGTTPKERTLLTTQLITDALRNETNSDLALSPNGSGLFGSFHSPDVSRYDITQIIPFKDLVVTADLTDTEVSALLKARPDTVISGDVTHLTPARTYRVALIDFIADSDYHIPSDQMHQTGRDSRDVIAAYFRKSKITSVNLAKK